MSLPFYPPFWFSPEEDGIGHQPVLYSSPLRIPIPSPSLDAHVALLPSLSPFTPSVVAASYTPRSIGSGAQCWGTAPDIHILRSCSQPCGTRIVRSCTSMLVRIYSRRQRQDPLIFLELWRKSLVQYPLSFFFPFP